MTNRNLAWFQRKKKRDCVWMVNSRGKAKLLFVAAKSCFDSVSLFRLSRLVSWWTQVRSTLQLSLFLQEVWRGRGTWIVVGQGRANKRFPRTLSCQLWRGRQRSCSSGPLLRRWGGRRNVLTGELKSEMLQLSVALSYIPDNELPSTSWQVFEDLGSFS